MANQRLHGVVIAVPTPLRENEDVDTDSLRRLIDYTVAEGADGVMISGTMGEGVSLVDGQKKVLLETAVEQAAGRVPILATVSETSTRRMLEYAAVACRAGADHLVCTAPFYYKYPDAESIIRHVRALAEKSTIPVVFYEQPAFTGNPVDVDTLDRILHLDNVVGIKYASGNYLDFADLLRRYPQPDERPGFIMQAYESVFDSSLLMGADGIVSGGGVAFIGMLKALYAAGSRGDRLDAAKFQREFSARLLQLLGPNPGRDWMYTVKAELVRRGVFAQACVTRPFMAP